MVPVPAAAGEGVEVTDEDEAETVLVAGRTAEDGTEAAGLRIEDDDADEEDEDDEEDEESSLLAAPAAAADGPRKDREVAGL
jgi:hypothetical protein